MIFIEILNKLHVGVINLLAIFITVSTFGLIGYALSRDKIISAMQHVFTAKTLEK